MNQLCTVGRLTADPDSKTVTVTVAGAERTVTTLGLAIPDGGDAEPVYIDVVVWDARAQACATYLRKGRRVAVTGRLDLARWTADDGTPRRVHRIIASRVDFLDGAHAAEPASTPIAAA